MRSIFGVCIIYFIRIHRKLVVDRIANCVFCHGDGFWNKVDCVGGCVITLDMGMKMNGYFHNSVLCIFLSSKLDMIDEVVEKVKDAV